MLAKISKAVAAFLSGGLIGALAPIVPYWLRQVAEPPELWTAVGTAVTGGLVAAFAVFQAPANAPSRATLQKQGEASPAARAEIRSAAKALAPVLALLLLVGAIVAGCAGNGLIATPVQTAQTLEQKAYALHGEYTIAAEAAATIVESPATPESVKAIIRQADKIAYPLAKLLRASAQGYGDVRERLAAAPGDAGLAAAAAAALAALQRAWLDAGPPMRALIGAVNQSKEG